MIRPKDHLSAGFTLVELLVALAIMAFISVMMLGGLRFGVTAWHRSDVLNATSGDLQIGRSVLERHLADAYPFYSIINPTSAQVDFVGRPEQIEFLARAPDAMGGAGLARFKIAVGDATRGKRLTLSARRELALSDGPLPPSTLVDRAEHIEFAYFGPAGNGPASWRDSWEDQKILPSLIRIRVTFAPNDGRRWPDLIVAPQISVDESCQYDVITRRCRGR